MRNRINQALEKADFKTLIWIPLFASVAWLLSGCQSNEIYFATSTQAGIQVGVDAKEIPQITIGYNRQEGVMLPLKMVADNGTNSPAKSASGAGVGTGKPSIADLKYVGTNNNKDTQREDAYSVIAILNVNSSGNVGSNSSAGAAMGVSQYFATGVAAQLLGEHGAAVVGGAPDGVASTNSSEHVLLEDLQPLKDAYVYFLNSDTNQLPVFKQAAQTIQINGNPLYVDFVHFLAGDPQDPTTNQVSIVRTKLTANTTIAPQIK